MIPQIRLIAGVAESGSRVVAAARSAREGEREIERLNNQVAQLQAELLESRRAREQERVLQQVLTFTVDRRILGQATPARVLAAGRWLIIENNELSPDLVVLSPQGAFVGVIDQVGRWVARVKLPTDSESQIPIFIEDPVTTSDNKETEASDSAIRAEGLLVGAFGGSMRAERVLTSVDLEAGQVISTRGADGALPPGLLIGWVEEQPEKQESAVYQSVNVRPAVDIQSLQTVVVIH